MPRVLSQSLVAAGLALSILAFSSSAQSTADLSIAITGPAEVTPGTNVTYKINLSNNGPSDSEGVHVRIGFPPPPILADPFNSWGWRPLSFVSSTNDFGWPMSSPDGPCNVPFAGYPENENPFWCNLGTLPAGTTWNLWATFSVPADYWGPDPLLEPGGDLRCLAEVATCPFWSTNPCSTPATPDPDLSNNIAGMFSSISRRSDLSVVKTGPASITPGQEAAYTISVRNQGPSDAAGVSVTDVPAPEMTFVENAGDCTTVFPCALGEADERILDQPVVLAAGATRSITSTYRAPSSLEAQAIENIASAEAPAIFCVSSFCSTSSDPNPSNNSSKTTATLTPQADLVLTKTGPEYATVGEQVGYTITVTNNGPSDATGVTLSDTAGTGLTFVRNAGDCATVFPCSLGTVLSGSSRIVSSIFLVSPETQPGPLENTATVSSPTQDPEPADNISTAVATVNVPTDLPLLSIGDASVTEGTGGMTDARFLVRLSRESDSVVTVRARTTDLTAKSGSDYVHLDEFCSFNPGETSRTLAVKVLGDADEEETETFALRLLLPATNALILDPQGIGVIVDDDGPSGTLDPAILVEGCERVGDPCVLTVASISGADQSDWEHEWKLSGVMSGTDASYSPVFEIPGSYTVDVRVSDSSGREGIASVSLTVRAACPEKRLCLLGSRFEVSLFARDHRTNRTTDGVAVQQDEAFGHYAFPALTGASDNPEVFIKILDGRIVNGHFWVFYGGLTDLEYEVTFVDSESGLSKTYIKPPGSSQGGFDVGSGVMPEDCAGEVDGLVHPLEAPSRCDEGTDHLCLMHGRFRIDLVARDQRTGNLGTGLAIPQNQTFGYFALPSLTGSSNNPEVFVKIIDGMTVNGHYWVFFGGLTDMEYTVTVTDLENEAAKSYTKAPGSACGAFDTDAF